MPAKLRWGGSEDAEGIAIPLTFEKDPVFCELTFDEDDDSNLMLEINGRWFYKSPNCHYIDLMPAFFDKKIELNASLTLKIFAPPASGENAPGEVDCYSVIEKLPKIRIDYEPPIPFSI